MLSYKSISFSSFPPFLPLHPLSSCPWKEHMMRSYSSRNWVSILCSDISITSLSAQLLRPPLLLLSAPLLRTTSTIYIYIGTNETPTPSTTALLIPSFLLPSPKPVRWLRQLRTESRPLSRSVWYRLLLHHSVSMEPLFLFLSPVSLFDSCIFFILF